MPEPHPAHRDLPALYRAQVGETRGRWRMSVHGPDRDTVAGPIDLGPADETTTAQTGDPGRHMIDIAGTVPTLPKEEAVRSLAEAGYVIEGAARGDALTDDGWTQIAAEWWTAPCHPIAGCTA
ncbi:hypothetical protein ACIQRE_01690 [Streptomyces griseoluteus]|uniref:hypothetical protein n=1 Tax=Streptomyces griseoluteus TaxID=29306 RepID=UPI00382A402A